MGNALKIGRTDPAIKTYWSRAVASMSAAAAIANAAFDTPNAFEVSDMRLALTAAQAWAARMAIPSYCAFDH
jgi:hypothetical protein